MWKIVQNPHIKDWIALWEHKKMKIFLNPGHGGCDPGAVSKNGLKEKDVAARVVKILEERLKFNGYPVQTYQEAKHFTEVSKEANKSGATLFISVHCNSASNSKAHGTEVLYYPTSIKGKELASILQAELIKATGLYNRGIKPRSDLHVLKATNAPAILAELAFISNPEEEKLLKEKPEIFANAIWEAIKLYKTRGLL